MKSIFYHIYPLGFAGAPLENNLTSDPLQRLDKLYEWIDYLEWMGFNAIYFGPVFESSSHGYDTVDYYRIDRRLGTNESFRELCRVLKSRGFKIILDGVFNHVSRDFGPFRDLQDKKKASPYKDWFKNVNFDQTSPLGDPFSYDCWEGYDSLVTLNLQNEEVRNHIFQAVKLWFDEFFIDGLRLDVAYCLDKNFLKELKSFTANLSTEFWVMGEIIHGDCRQWIDHGLLDSATNYECYKGIYSSLNDHNYFEIAHSLNRQFGQSGIYENYSLYNFIDNHDVSRIRSILQDKRHVYNAMILLFTMPGIPSVYYGSEWQIEGARTEHSDGALRPSLDLSAIRDSEPSRAMEKLVRSLIEIRKSSSVFEKGSYREVAVESEQLVFERVHEGQRCICALNASDSDAYIDLHHVFGGMYEDLLNNNEEHNVHNGEFKLHLWPNWGSVYLLKM